jgi:hypothetical protein
MQQFINEKATYTREIIKKIARRFGYDLRYHNRRLYFDKAIDPSTLYPLEQNYDVSVIIPFYKKIKEFSVVLPKNAPYFQRNGIEVIIALDEPSQEHELLALIKQFPFINWKIIVNDKPHEWRNPAKAINVGIRHATKKYVFVMSPESEFVTDAISELVSAVRLKEYVYALGTVQLENYRHKKWFPYGSICVRRIHLEQIKGYTEQFTEWGADDDEVRARLRNNGLREIVLNETRLIHREFEQRPSKKVAPLNKTTYQSVLQKNTVTTNTDSWGTDFARIAYDYQHNIYGYELLEGYLKNFEAYSINRDLLGKQYTIIALVQMHNNAKTIDWFLKNLDRHCDGIILLDDESSDGSYNAAQHSKIIARVKKKRNGFNDLENRNILLNIASFVRLEYLYFIDTDEVVDDRFESVRSAANSGADSIAFKFIHLWDNEETYNKQWPFSEQGVQYKFRMSKNMGRAQIITHKRLHFRPMPYFGKQYVSRVLVRHYGNLTKERRIKKYNFYKEHDINNDQKSYVHLLDENPPVGRVDEIRL